MKRKQQNAKHARKGNNTRLTDKSESKMSDRGLTDLV